MRIIRTPAEYERFYKAITDVKDRPSDPAVLQDTSIRMNQSVPADHARGAGSAL
jgi:hypothetical protein